MLDDDTDVEPLRRPSPRQSGASAPRRVASRVSHGSAAAAAEFKIVLVGKSGAGKTSLGQRYVKGVSPTEGPGVATVGAAYMIAQESVADQASGDDVSVSLCIWDTAGQESFASVVPLYFRDCDAVVLVVDGTDDAGLEGAVKWLGHARASAPPDAPVYLAVTKADLPARMAVAEEAAAGFAADHNIAAPVAFVSSVTGRGVKRLFSAVAARAWSSGGGRRSHGPGCRPGAVVLAGASGPIGKSGNGAKAASSTKKKKCC